MKLAAAPALLVFAACGDNATSAPTLADAPSAACAAAFSGNLTTTLASPDDCATTRLAHGHRFVEFAIPIAAIHAAMTMSFDLGVSAAPGLYTSETVAAWSARAAQTFGTSSVCIYAGGSDTAPQGSFTLVLAAIDVAAGTAHGTARLALAALTPDAVPCGPIDIERVELTF